MRKASTRLLEQGIQAPSPAPDLIPAETKTSTENLHWDWYSKRGHFSGPFDFFRNHVVLTNDGLIPQAGIEQDLERLGWFHIGTTLEELRIRRLQIN